MFGSNIKLDMPVFLYEMGQHEGKNGNMCIKGRYGSSDGKAEFQGFIEIDDEIFDIKSIDFKSNDGQGSIMILAGYNKEGTELSRGAAAYLDKDLKYIKGTLYRFTGMNISPIEFAAPASNMEEAAEISQKLMSNGMTTGIIKGRDGSYEYR